MACSQVQIGAVLLGRDECVGVGVCAYVCYETVFGGELGDAGLLT